MTKQPGGSTGRIPNKRRPFGAQGIDETSAGLDDRYIYTDDGPAPTSRRQARRAVKVLAKKMGIEPPEGI